jgi:hypothetical protein
VLQGVFTNKKPWDSGHIVIIVNIHFTGKGTEAQKVAPGHNLSKRWSQDQGFRSSYFQPTYSAPHTQKISFNYTEVIVTDKVN